MKISIVDLKRARVGDTRLSAFGIYLFEHIRQKGHYFIYGLFVAFYDIFGFAIFFEDMNKVKASCFAQWGDEAIRPKARLLKSCVLVLRQSRLVWRTPGMDIHSASGGSSRDGLGVPTIL